MILRTRCPAELISTKSFKYDCRWLLGMAIVEQDVDTRNEDVTPFDIALAHHHSLRNVIGI